MEQPTTTTEAAPRRPRILPALPGVALGPLAFAFGALPALLVLPALLPWLKRLRPAAYVGFASVAACWALAAVGVNPWVDFARDSALARMEAALGAPVQYDSFEGDALGGRLTFTGLRAELPDGAGTISARAAELSLGYGLVGGTPALAVQELDASLDPAGGRLERYLARGDGDGLAIHVDGGRIEFRGDETGAVFHLQSASGTLGSRIACELASADVTLLGRAHRVEITGGVTIESGDALRVSTTMVFHKEGVLHGMLTGALEPGGAGALKCTLDSLQLQPVWGTYRQVDVLSGELKGEVELTGQLTDLRADLRLRGENVRYFHRVAMDLDESRRFEMAESQLTGALSLRDGASWLLHALTLRSPDCTLATNPACQAVGSGVLVLDGPAHALKGTLDATVDLARIRQPITWNAMSATTLDDIAPNLIGLGEQFRGLELQWKADVRSLDIDCAPVSGKLAGVLTGSFVKKPDSGTATTRASGRLEMQQGRFEFLGARGELAGAIEFNESTPPRYATLKGRLTGSVGSTPLNAQIAGRLDRPELKFTGVDMKPDELGRKIYTHADTPLTAGQQLARREQCAQLTGTAPANQQNPFAVMNTRAAPVTFTFAP